MAVQFLSRATLGLPPVGTLHEQRQITGGYPYPRPHKYFTRINTHHTVTILKDWDHDGIINGDIEDIAKFMRDLMTAREADLGPEVPYSFVVFETPDPNNAIIAEGRGFEIVGAHTQGENSSSYGVAFAGNTTIRPITKGMIEAVNWVGSKCYDPRTMRKTLGHRDHKATNCPGDSAYTHLDSMQPPFPLAPRVQESFVKTLVTDAVGFCVLGNNDLVIVNSTGAVFHFDADGLVDNVDYQGGYNAHPEHGAGSDPRQCIGVYAVNGDNWTPNPSGTDYCQVFNDGARYTWWKAK